MSDSRLSREDLQRQIAGRLSRLDDESLLRLDAISQYGVERARPAPQPISGATAAGDVEAGGISRRGFLIGAGGLALAGTVAGGAFIGSAAVAPELAKLQALIALYEELEQVGLDTIVSGGIAAFGGALGLARAAAAIVGAGIKVVDGAVLNFEQLFPAARQGITAVEGLVSALANQVRDFEQVLTGVTGAASPMTDAIGKFFGDLLDKIPFGVGANVRDLINRLVALIGAVPALIDGVNTNLLTPLRTDWFSDDDSKGLKGNLFEPVRTRVLQPAGALVDQINTLADNWQTTIAPINQAIARRAEVRKQIEALKQ